MKLLIAVLSAAPYSSRRDICRNGWFRQLLEPKIAPVVDAHFFIGKQPDICKEPLVRELTCPDDYRGLPLKTRALCKYYDVPYSDYDYIFKCDDDTFVHVPRLIERTEQALQNNEDYVGSMKTYMVTPKPADFKEYQYAQGGAGYLLSKKAIGIVGKAPQFWGEEDIWVGKVLSEAGINATHDARFHQNSDEHPETENDIITSHFIRSHGLAKRLQQQIEEVMRFDEEVEQARAIYEKLRIAQEDLAKTKDTIDVLEGQLHTVTETEST